MSKKILVVDDEKLIVKGICFSLEQEGMEVDCAYDGEEALEYAKKCEYDLVLLDVMLPKLDGFQVCQQIREFCLQSVILLEQGKLIFRSIAKGDLTFVDYSMVYLLMYACTLNNKREK